jgi:hypothetical protein
VIRLRLPQEESQRLDLAYRQVTDPTFRDRIQIARLAARDRPHKEIADHLAHRPTLAQRLPRARPRWPASAQGGCSSFSFAIPMLSEADFRVAGPVLG